MSHDRAHERAWRAGAAPAPRMLRVLVGSFAVVVAAACVLAYALAWRSAPKAGFSALCVLFGVVQLALSTATGWLMRLRTPTRERLMVDELRPCFGAREARALERVFGLAFVAALVGLWRAGGDAFAAAVVFGLSFTDAMILLRAKAPAALPALPQSH